MKKGLIVVALLCCLGVITCGDNDTELDITITSQPSGGANITIVTCTFEAELVGGTTPITATVEWCWEDGNHQNETIVFSDQWTFSSKSPEEVNTYFSAPSGYVLLNYYWVRITWTDEDGTDNELESNKAYCHY